MDKLDQLQSEFQAVVRSTPDQSSTPSMVLLARKTGKDPFVTVNKLDTTPEGRVYTSSTTTTLSQIFHSSFDPFIAMVEESHDAARKEGLFGLMRVKAEAWLEEHLTDASVRKLRSRQIMLDEQRKTVEAGHRLHRAVHGGDSGQAGPSNDQPHLPQPHSPQISTSTTPASAPLRPSLTDRQIECAAIRALLEGAVSDETWAPYKAALMMQLPPYAVQEIENRMQELWSLNPEGPDLKFL